MVEEVEGIVVHVHDYGETSKILNIMTKEHGIIGVMSKGCKKLKSDLRSVSSKMTYGIFQLYYKPNKLSTLVSVDVLDRFKFIQQDITMISYASFLLELGEQVMKQNYNEQIYTLLISSIQKINEGYDPMVITNILELKYLNYLGVMPILDGCAICGSNKSIATLSSTKGGYVCNQCLKNEKIVDQKTIKLIRMFYYVDISKITKLDISNQVKHEINDFLDEYYEQYTGLYLRSKSFLKNLNKIG